VLPALLSAVVLLAAVFCFLNGFHDVSNSVATAVRTRALTPSMAVLVAAVFNAVGTLMGAGLVLLLVAGNDFGLPAGTEGLGMLLAALTGASLWNILTWWARMPSSSTHALIGGLVGAGFASALLGGSGITEARNIIWLAVALPLLLSPLVAFGLSYLLVTPVSWLGRHRAPHQLNTGYRMGQSVAAAVFALGHGLQDGQRTMSVLMLALVASGLSAGTAIPVWIPVFAALFLAAGTLFGGWRITHTLSYKLVNIDPMRGMIAQGVGSTLLFLGAIAFHLPLSSTHTVTSAIVGAGANHRFESVRWGAAGRILAVWLFSPAATALLGAVFYLAVSPLL
jgi:PiT family inorganic phosphate transporter